MHHPTRLLGYGFFVILLMMTALLAASYFIHRDNSSAIVASINLRLDKIELLSDMAEVAHQRNQNLQSILLEDASLIDANWMDVNRYANDYRNASLKLQPLLLPAETEAMKLIEDLQLGLDRSTRLLISFFRNRHSAKAINLMQQEIQPKTATLLNLLSDRIAEQRQAMHQALLQTINNNEDNRVLLVVFFIIAILISAVVAVLVIAFDRKLLLQLQDMNTYLEDRVDERTESLLDKQKELVEDNTQLAHLASTDRLTGLSNRSHMEEILEKEHARYQRYWQGFGVIMLDIDHFKNVNDKHGHDTGDRVLIDLSRQLSKAIRGSDYLARWGGEEFLICCTSINESDLLPIAEVIRKKVMQVDFGVDQRITVSLGGAYIQQAEKINELIKRADVALYSAKENGRNQSAVSQFTDSDL